MPNLLFALLCLVAVLPAQTVRVANNSGSPFEGWLRCTVDTKPAHASGVLPDQTRYVLGRRCGKDLWAIDLQIKLATNERRSVDLSTATSSPFAISALPSDILGHFGGWVAIGGVPMGIEELGIEGAAVVATFACRPSPLLHARLWIRFYPDQPGTIPAELVLTASNPTIPDLFVSTPTQPIRIAWGDSWLWTVGAGFGAPVLPLGTIMCDGQCRAMPLVFGWQRHWKTPAHVQQFATAAGLNVNAVGVDKLYPEGNPKLPANFDGAAWTGQHMPLALSVLHSWAPSTLGVNPFSGSTGGFEDQVWVRGECYATSNGPGCEQLAYLTALKQMQRPCHHLLADGTQADPSNFPGVMFWYGRPHPATGNLLGKPRVATIEDTNGWAGPDREHWSESSAMAGFRLTGSRAAQWELRQQALLYLWSDTLPSEKPANWATNGPDAARAIFYAALLVQHLDENLEDRALAARVLQRLGKRLTEVYLPAWRNAAYDVWDVRLDPRLDLGDGRRGAMFWQLSVAADGMDRAGRLTGNQEARQIALKGAKAVLQIAWRLVPWGPWIAWDNVCIPPPIEYVEGDTAHRTGWYDTTWMLPGLAVILAHEPTNSKANTIWQQVRPFAAKSWWPPQLP